MGWVTVTVRVRVTFIIFVSQVKLIDQQLKARESLPISQSKYGKDVGRMGWVSVTVTVRVTVRVSMTVRVRVKSKDGKDG